MFDLANQSFTLLINTLLFAVFFREVIAGPAIEGTGDFLWGLTVAISMAVVVLTGPVIGALADCRVWKKQLLVWFGVGCVLLTASLGLLPSGEAGLVAVAIAMAVYIPANVFYNLGENMLAAFLPEIASRRNIGRVSAIGWTMGYIGALLLLVCVLGMVAGFGLDAPTDWRPLFVFAAVWFAVMAIPTVLFLPETACGQPLPEARTVVGAAFKRVTQSIRHAAEYRDLSVFLVSFFVYGFGVQAVIFFASIIAKSDFGFDTPGLVVFTAIITVMAGIGAVGVGFLQDRLGHRNTVGLFLALWVVNALGLALVTWLLDRHVASGLPADEFPRWPIYIVGNGIGLGLGGIGSASRAIVGYLTPRHRTAEFFGLWGLAYKSAGAIGALGFGALRELLGSVPSLFTLAGVFAAGGIGLSFISEHRGAARAARAEAEDQRAPAWVAGGRAPSRRVDFL